MSVSNNPHNTIVAGRTLIDCEWCKNWGEDQRFNSHCLWCKDKRKVIEPSQVLCNLCGGKMTPIHDHNSNEIMGLQDLVVVGGYNSYHLSDMNIYTFSLCEECLRKLFVQSKIKPLVFYSMGPIDRDHWEEDQRWYEYRVWKDTGGYHQAYMDGKCNAIKDCSNDAIYTVLHGGEDDEFSEGAHCEEHKDLHGAINNRLTKFIPANLKAFL